MKATKLPSGNWRVRIEIGKDENGRRLWKSFTGEDKSLVELEAAQFQVDHRRKESCIDKSAFSERANAFISSRNAVLSPSTVRMYKSCLKMLKAKVPWFCDKKAYSITESDAQSVIDVLTCSGLKPKTVRNYYAFITDVLNFCKVRLEPPVLPQKLRPDYVIPDEVVIQDLLQKAKGTELEIPIMLAAFGPLRRGEICALTLDDIRGNVVHVSKDVVRGPDGNWVVKPPKTFSSDRYIEMPEFVVDRIREVGVIVRDGLNPDGLSHSFKRFLKRNDLPDFRFHDLRHFCCSYLHSQNVPDIYIMQRSGHSTTAVLRQVYTHTLQNQSKLVTEKINGDFTKMAAESQNP